MQNYKKLDVWKKSHQFVLDLYKATQYFPKGEIYVMVNQMRKAAISVPANIAEGCGKNSQRDLSRFLSISLGSAHESEYYLLLGFDLGYLTDETFENLFKLINEIKAMLIGLIAKIGISV